MYGRRGRVGVLVPSTNFVAEIELSRMMPDGVSIHTARCMFEDTSEEANKIDRLLAMSKNVVRAAREVACVKPRVIVWACTSGSFLQGAENEGAIEREIQSATGIPAVTTSTAMIETIRAMHITRLALVTPYIHEINESQVRFLEERIKGLKVINVYSLGILSTIAKSQMEPETAYDAGLRGDRPEAQGIFISCTAWRTIEILKPLEEALRKPVISSNQATAWAALQRMNLRGDPRWGSLFGTER